MFQLFLLIVSFVYGIIVGLFSSLLKDKKILKIFSFIIMTIIYVGIFYFINNGKIHLYNKMMLILGFCVYYFLINVKLNVKLRKIYRNKKNM